jgi:hypothetical protein
MHESISKNNQTQIQAAGPRYTPGIDPSAPNIEISELTDAIASLTLSSLIRDRFNEASKEINKVCSDYASSIGKIFAKSADSPQKLSASLQDLSKVGPANIHVKKHEVVSSLSAVRKIITPLIAQAHADVRNTKEGEQEHIRAQGVLNCLKSLDNSLDPLETFFNSEAARMLTQNVLFVLGQWGTGKTHFLCDVTTGRMRNGKATVLILGHRLPRTTPSIDQFLASEKISDNWTDLLKYLDQEGAKTGERSLLLIDAINEGPHDLLKVELPKLIESMNSFPSVGLVLTCRIPFQNLILDKKLFDEIPSIEHVGFSESEFTAQKEFFHFYGIPFPEMPLLSEEFSRPLFLKTVCESLKDLSQGKRQSNFDGITSGQVGFTKILEDFFKRVGGPIEKKLGLQGLTCWRFCKEPLAEKMALKLQNFLTKKDCIDVVESLVDKSKSNQFLEELIFSGLLVTDVDPNTNTEIIRLPYERFSDHIIARHLLRKPYFDNSSVQSIKDSFKVSSHLGRIFSVDKYKRAFAFPGLAEAIMLEFPLRVTKALGDDLRELVFYLPKESALVNPSFEIFLNGLYWRPRSSFCKQTAEMISILLDSDVNEVYYRTLDTIISLSTKKNHPVSSKKLFAFLTSMKLPDRDLYWSEFLRKHQDRSSLRKILDWILRTNPQSLDLEITENFIRILCLCLTTTDRRLRDESTRALVILGKVNLNLLFEVALEMLKFNDPYVSERALCACYGASMARVAHLKKEEIESIGKFLNKLNKRIAQEKIGISAKHALS